ncbi:secreted RxLR effector protein 78-like [Nicotiana tomentosiformis]|uniref:secreted RxLR effector protein 78-like n=1 Tax=Nicotiana tomentosiformis TaxID=4098 RepID=UPI00388C6F32
MEKILPLLISPNQSGFVKGRSIFENVRLTQEIITDIRLREKPANVLIKLDMAKTCDRVSWKYLLHVLRKMGFAEHFINMIGNLLINNWYSCLINGQATGYFKTSKGVKQGDPLSPALFILSVKVLSISLNNLFLDKKFKGFGMPKWTDPLNHLAYADDTIIFSFTDPYSLKKVVDVLTNYE